MVKSITILSKSGNESVILDDNFDNAIAIPCTNQKSFDIEIEFLEPIALFRNHDYQWADLKKDRIANTFSPKIIKLSNGFYVQSNTNHGIWEVQKKHPEKLFWRFNPQDSNPLVNYSGSNNQKTVTSANPNLDHFITPVLLFSKTGAVELSRSKIPFVPTACFTDHCDFDTAGNLKQEREFFKTHSIKITKGFFLNHFSKRSDNASWENDAAELQQWQADGHELCYHSLSQSIKTKEESLSDFFSFSPPLPISTWIDHGYQPYNLSMYQKEGLDESVFAANFSSKKIEILWNYIDSGTATSGVLNQLNTSHFTLQSFSDGIQHKSFKKRISLLIKNSIVHFYNDEKLIKKYALLASDFKKFAKSKSPATLVSFSGKAYKVSVPLLKLLLFWNRFKTKTYPLAKYQNLFFEHQIADKKFVIFQTLELLDFVNALDKKSVDTFMNEKGMFIGHTYFSVPMEYHDGKIFTKSGGINPKVNANFDYLGQMIRHGKIWNPTVQELVAFWKEYNQVQFQVAENGEISTTVTTEIPHRIIT